MKAPMVSARNLDRLNGAIECIGATLSWLGSTWETRLVTNEGDLLFWFFRRRTPAGFYLVVMPSTDGYALYLNYDGGVAHASDLFGTPVHAATIADLRKALKQRATKEATRWHNVWMCT